MSNNLILYKWILAIHYKNDKKHLSIEKDGEEATF
jgi:hypothetical protein